MAVRITVKRYADWRGVRELMRIMPRQTKRAINKALHKESELLRKMIQLGIRNQAPGGRPFERLSKLTLATRRVRRGSKRGSGTKTLMVDGDLLRGISTTKIPEGFFVGIRRNARRRDGQLLFRIAAVHEFGYGPIVIPITDKMRGFLAKLFEEAGGSAGSSPSSSSAGSATGVIVITIKARPFLVPTFGVWLTSMQGGVKNRLPRGIVHELQVALAKKKISRKYIRGPGQNLSFSDLRIKGR
jgi:hypothetical protein